MFAGSRTFWKWFIFGFYASAALVYFPVYGMGWAFTYTNSEGVVTFPLAYEGSVVFWSIIVVSCFAGRPADAVSGRATLDRLGLELGSSVATQCRIGRYLHPKAPERARSRGVFFQLLLGRLLTGREPSVWQFMRAGGAAVA